MEPSSITPREAAVDAAAVVSVSAFAVPERELPTSSIPSAVGTLSSPTIAIRNTQTHATTVKTATKTSEQLKAQDSASILDLTDLKASRGISNKHRAFLLKAGFTTTTEVLFTPLRPLSDRLKLPEAECRELLHAIVSERKKRWITDGRSRSVAERLRANTCAGAQAASDQEGQTAFQEPPCLEYGDDGFQSLLGGGLVPGTITEVAGEASSGKTAFSLQLSLRVQLEVRRGGLAGSCAYLSSEGNFPSTRLRDMAFKLSDGSSEGIKAFMDNVHLVHCPEVDELLHVVRYSLPAMVEQSQPSFVPTSNGIKLFNKPVKLVVVDSIAAPFRGSEGGSGNKQGAVTEEDINKSANTSLVERNAALQEISFRLRRLARQYSIVVLVVNQVSDVFHKDNDRFSGSQAHPSSQAGGSSVTHENGGIPLDYRNYKHASKFFTGEEADLQKNSKIAVFGLSWSNCIDMRIMLSRTGRRRRKDDGMEVIMQCPIIDDQGMEIEDPLFALETEEIRRATLVFSPFVDKGYVDYALRQEGLVTVGEYHHTPRGPAPARRRKAGQSANLLRSKNKIMPMSLNGLSHEEEEEDDSEDEEEALWAGLPLDEASLSQL